jgi:hypothetical protein
MHVGETRKEYLHVVHTDRINIPDTPPNMGTIAFHEAAGERDPTTDNQSKWKLRVARVPCYCFFLVLSWKDLRAMQLANTCMYHDVRQEEFHWVCEQAASGQRTISMASTEFDQYKEKLTKIVKGNGSITKTMLQAPGSRLQDRLRLLGKPVSGNKSVLAERLLVVALVNYGETTPNDLPLAADYITDEQELDGVVEEEDSDDDDDVDDGEGAST